MDKKTIIGFVLIGLILIGYSWYIRPSAEQQAAAKHRRDSIAAVREAERAAAMLEAQMAQEAAEKAAAEVRSNTAIYGDFAAAAEGEEQFTTLENDRLQLTISNKGGRISEARLKNYVTTDSLPLYLFQGDESRLGFTLLTSNNRVIDTQDLFFKPVVQNDTTLAMRLAVNDTSYIDFRYTLPRDEYMLLFDIEAHNMQAYLSPQMTSLNMLWEQDIRQQEKSRKFESRYATLTYRYTGDDVEQMSESKNDSEKTSGRVQWIAFKDQFFSTIFIADESFISPTLDSKMENARVGYLKHYKAETSVAFDPKGNKATNFRLYMGPNQYKILRSYDDEVENSDDRLRLEKIIPLGWAIFRWVSEWFVIPLFNFLNRYIANFGIIILLMTIVVKLVLLPFTYKSYMSTAKMRVLKPQIDEINAKYPPEKAMERQQATMALYNKVGVSPMSGCLPMLLQMPILFAMFAFFPTAIELRQQSFLWAHDLSSYDAIVSWDAYIPFITPYFGNHISLFCLLMTITNIVYTKINMSSQAGAADQMKVMKWMMYLMPLMFLFIFNDYASGLSYYYFISLLFTILQTYIFRLCIDEKKLLAKLEAKKAKPSKKKGFLARLEAAQREQMKAMQQQQKRR
jgi:YidC/Oxa1 family membrane protein insertase